MKKIFTMLLVFCLVFSASFSAFGGSATLANNSETLVTDAATAIRLIEKAHLSVQENGQLVISKEAKSEINLELLQQIEKSMDVVNELVFSRRTSISKNFEVTLSHDFAQELNSFVKASEGGVNKVVARWYGLDFYFDSIQSNIKAAEYAIAASYMAGATAAVAAIPGVGKIAIGVLGVTAGNLGAISGTLWLGSATGRGTIVQHLLFVSTGVPAVIPRGVYLIPFDADLQQLFF